MIENNENIIKDNFLLFTIMQNNFRDDNTFSQASKNKALIGIMTKDLPDEEEVIIQIIDRKYLYTEIFNKNYIIKHVTSNWVPVIKFIK